MLKIVDSKLINEENILSLKILSKFLKVLKKEGLNFELLDKKYLFLENNYLDVNKIDYEFYLNLENKKLEALSEKDLEIIRLNFAKVLENQGIKITENKLESEYIYLAKRPYYFKIKLYLIKFENEVKMIKNGEIITLGSQNELEKYERRLDDINRRKLKLEMCKSNGDEEQIHLEKEFKIIGGQR